MTPFQGLTEYLLLTIGKPTKLTSKPIVQAVVIQDGHLPPKNALDPTLAKVPTTIDEDDDDDSSDEDYINSRPPAEVILEALIDTLDSIYRLSIRIRNTKTRLPKPSARLLKHIDESTGVDLFARMREVDLLHVEELFREYRALPSESAQAFVTRKTTLEDGDRLRRPQTLDAEDAPLRSRMAQANTLRRQQFAYWRRNRDKHAKETAEALDLVKTPPATQNQAAPRFKGQQRYGPKTLAALSRPSTATQLLQHTAMSIENSDAKSSTSTRTVIPKATSTRDEDVQVPAPPTALQGSKEIQSSFECPYCFIICPATLLGSEAWRQVFSFPIS